MSASNKEFKFNEIAQISRKNQPPALHAKGSVRGRLAITEDLMRLESVWDDFSRILCF
jgi:hypothetical protein